MLVVDSHKIVQYHLFLIYNLITNVIDLWPKSQQNK